MDESFLCNAVRSEGIGQRLPSHVERMSSGQRFAGSAETERVQVPRECLEQFSCAIPLICNCHVVRRSIDERRVVCRGFSSVLFVVN